jgi:hypothetical protein
MKSSSVVWYSALGVRRPDLELQPELDGVLAGDAVELLFLQARKR